MVAFKARLRCGLALEDTRVAMRHCGGLSAAELRIPRETTIDEAGIFSVDGNDQGGR